MLLHCRTGARPNIDMRLPEFEFLVGHTSSVHLRLVELLDGLVGIVLLACEGVL
jgi:hypothetical protein